MIELKNVCKSFDDGKSFAVKDVSLTIQKGEILVILGSSGSGKTTLLRMINRLLNVSHGNILIDGVDIEHQDPISLRRSIGYHFQGVGLFPHLTVGENITIVLRLLGKSLQERQRRAQELLHLVNLPAEYHDHTIKELSGGQQQRVGVARALANDPSYLLMDEPFGAVDSITRSHLQGELLHISKALNKTIIFVTHDILEAFRLADRIAIMNNGIVEQIGTKTEILKAPKTEFVRNIIQIPIKQIANLME